MPVQGWERASFPGITEACKTEDREKLYFCRFSSVLYYYSSFLARIYWIFKVWRMLPSFTHTTKLFTCDHRWKAGANPTWRQNSCSDNVWDRCKNYCSVQKTTDNLKTNWLAHRIQNLWEERRLQESTWSISNKSICIFGYLWILEIVKWQVCKGVDFSQEYK